MATVYPNTIQGPPGGTGMEELLNDEFASKLLSLAKANADKYATARPFPHIYFDDFLPPQPAEVALRDFPEPRQILLLFVVEKTFLNQERRGEAVYL
jgi:hypothetical protein